VTTEWVIGILATFFASLIGIMWRKISGNEDKLHRHDVMFATLMTIPDSLEKHEEREEKQFDILQHRMDNLDSSVAQVKLSVAKLLNGK